MQHSATRETEDGLGNFVGAVCGMHHECGPAPSAGAFYAEAGFVLVAS